MLLKDKCAVITGGSQGIGLGIALAMAGEGASVAIPSIYKDGDAVKAQFGEYASNVELYPCDVTDYDKVEQVVKEITSRFSKIDILVNNAGITKDQLMIKMTEADFASVIDVNLKGTFNFSRHVGRLMFRQKYGRIINISSVAGIYGNMGQVNYSASKAGVIGLTKSASKELGSRGITVNAIAPGFVETNMTDVLDEKIRMALFDRLSIKRLGQVEDIANAAVFLASDMASYITGQVICVDGGITL